MRPVTNSFLNTVRGAHKAVFRATLTYPWATGVQPTGSVIEIESGSVSFDVNSDVNGTMDCTVVVPWLAISPYVHEIFLERGVQYANGTKEFVGLGYFRINSTEQVDVTQGLIRLTGEDRMSYLRDGRVTQPVQFSSSASVGAVLDFCVQDVMPTVTTLYDSTNWPGGTAYGTTLGSSHILDQDRLKFIQELVTAYGKIAYFDYAGRFVVKDAPSPTGAAVWDINAGALGVMVSASRTISRDGVFNGVVATGEPAGAAPPVRGIALDLDPSSPTYWNGVFGKVPRFFSSSFLLTNQQCVSTAQKLLSASKGAPYSVDLTIAPNPALEAWDVVNVIYPDNTNETHILDKITYSLDVETGMSLETRKQFLD